MNGAEGGEHGENGEPFSDAATEEPVSAIIEGSTGARTRWGKAVKCVVATDAVQVGARYQAKSCHARHAASVAHPVCARTT